MHMKTVVLSFGKISRKHSFHKILYPSLISEPFSVGDTLKAKVPANMLIYSTSDYRGMTFFLVIGVLVLKRLPPESQMITGDIQSPQVWNQDLQSLADVTYLSVSVNPNTQQVSITQER